MQKRTNKIGIIVPVYKVEEYITECIDSILAQTYTNFRLILVNDGTPDNAGKICDEYAKKDSRITVIHQENAGVTRARARGVEEATDCEWITFVDGDDTLPPRGLEELLLSSLENEKIDIVLGYRIEVLKGAKKHIYNKIGTGIYNPIEYINAMLIDDCIIGPWGKIIKRKLFDPSIFNITRTVVQYEDLYMNIALACKARNIFIGNDVLAYNHKEDSCTSQAIRNGFMKENGWFELLSSIKKIFEKNGFMEKVSYNFSKFAYIRICGCMEHNRSRFTSCRLLDIKRYNNMQDSVYKANINSFTYYIYRLKRFTKRILRRN